MNHRIVLLSLVLSSALSSGVARADAATAEALFRQGKDLLARKSYAEACPKLAESYRLDPATGTLLALAICHEQSGRLASAWSTYNDVLGRAQKEGQADRITLATERIAVLEARLPRLKVTVPAEVLALPGFELRRDDVVVGAASSGVLLPIDPGPHQLEARARGKLPWRQTVDAKAGERLAVVVPPLADDPAASTGAPAAATGDPAASTGAAQASGPSAPGVSSAAAPPGPAPGAPSPALRTVAFIGGGLGVVGVGIGTWASLRAVGKNDDSNTPGGCRGDACSPRGKDDRDAARRAGTLATVSLLAGGTLVAGALVLYLVKGRHHEPEAAHWQVAPAVGPRYGGLALGGSF